MGSPNTEKGVQARVSVTALKGWSHLILIGILMNPQTTSVWRIREKRGRTSNMQPMLFSTCKRLKNVSVSGSTTNISSLDIIIVLGYHRSQEAVVHAYHGWSRTNTSMNQER